MTDKLLHQPIHADDAAVDSLATAQKTELARKRGQGYGGWDTDCTQQRLSDLLRVAVDKGNPVAVANFCAFLNARGERISPPAPAISLEARQTLTAAAGLLLGHGHHESATTLQRLIGAFTTQPPRLDATANAARLLRAAAHELQQSHTQSRDRNDWTGEADAKAAYDEHMDAAAALEANEARDFPAMTPDLASILGMICYQCIPFAKALRAAGHQIDKRAEDEQAAVLYWMLGHWFRHGESWREHAYADMERMKAVTQEGGAA